MTLVTSVSSRIRRRSPTAGHQRHRARGVRPVSRLIFAVVLVIAIPVLVLLEVWLLLTVTAPD